MKQLRASVNTLGIHTALVIAVIVSSVPFYWAAQNSIKSPVTRSGARRPSGFDITADPYRKFWFRNEDQSIWQVARSS